MRMLFAARETQRENTGKRESCLGVVEGVGPRLIVGVLGTGRGRGGVEVQLGRGWEEVSWPLMRCTNQIVDGALRSNNAMTLNKSINGGRYGG
jgi:hypothetical protein